MVLDTMEETIPPCTLDTGGHVPCVVHVIRPCFARLILVPAPCLNRLINMSVSLTLKSTLGPCAGRIIRIALMGSRLAIGVPALE